MLAHQERYEEVMELLKDAGVRITPQRQAILQHLLETKDHPTADDIYKALAARFPNMSVATVYNNLRVFKELGIVSELTFGDASSRFDANIKHQHYHVICKECGKIQDYEHPSLKMLEREAAEKTGFQIDSHRLELYGLCPECSNKH